MCSNCGRISIVGSEKAKYCSTVCREARNSRESHRRKAMIEKDDSYTSEVENEATIRILDKILNEAGLKQCDKMIWSYSQKTGKLTLSIKKDM